jgi:malate dehydrogenase (oxaloacetate-decarboxylating)
MEDEACRSHGAADVRCRRGGSVRQALEDARAISGCISPRELTTEFIVPSVFNRAVVQRVAAEVRQAAIKAWVARKQG